MTEDTFTITRIKARCECGANVTFYPDGPVEKKCWKCSQLYHVIIHVEKVEESNGIQDS